MNSDEKACPFCGEIIKSVAIKCKHCQSDLSAPTIGKPPSATVTPNATSTTVFVNTSGRSDSLSSAKLILEVESRKKSGWLAAFLNLVIPGAGYAYCGRWFLGIVVFFLVVGIYIATLGIAALFLWIILVVDGFLCAGRYNRDILKEIIVEQELKDALIQNSNAAPTQIQNNVSPPPSRHIAPPAASENNIVDAAPTPAGIPPTQRQQFFSNPLILISIPVVLIGGFFLISSHLNKENTKESISASKEQPKQSVASVAAKTTKPFSVSSTDTSVPPAPSPEPTPQAITSQSSTSPAAQVLAMLAAARDGNNAEILSAKVTLDSFPKPDRGDRKLAREKNKLGLDALKENAYEVAIGLFSEGVAFDPSDVEVKNNLGYALMMFGKLDDAKKALMESIALDSARAAAWANLGQTFAKLGDQELAVAAFTNTFIFSRAQNKTIEFLTTLSQSDPDQLVKSAALKALDTPLIKGAITKNP